MSTHDTMRYAITAIGNASYELFSEAPWARTVLRLETEEGIDRAVGSFDLPRIQDTSERKLVIMTAHHKGYRLLERHNLLTSCGPECGAWKLTSGSGVSLAIESVDLGSGQLSLLPERQYPSELAHIEQLLENVAFYGSVVDIPTCAKLLRRAEDGKIVPRPNKHCYPTAVAILQEGFGHRLAFEPSERFLAQVRDSIEQ